MILPIYISEYASLFNCSVPFGTVVDGFLVYFIDVSLFIADEFDAYIIVSFVNATLVLSIGDTVEEVTDSGFLGTTPTLCCSSLGDDALVQVFIKLSNESNVIRTTRRHGFCTVSAETLANLSSLIHGVTYEFLVTQNFTLGKVPGPRIESINALCIYCLVNSFFRCEDTCV